VSRSDRPDTRGDIRFLLGHRPRRVAGCDPTLTVLDYLRLDAGLRGTKEGCNEGDCGACTVVVAEPDGERLRYRAINACIHLLAMIDGKQLITVEDLTAADGGPHPVQKAMVASHGSQCGFCTPGFVMALFALYHTTPRPDRAAIDEALAGNLCRCTGYGPIIAAARRMADEGDRDDFSARETETLAALADLRDDRPLALEHGGRHWFAPRDTDALAALALAHPDATLMAGATDAALWLTKGLRVLETVIHLGAVRDLAHIRVADGWIEIGATATYADIEPVIAAHYPDFGALIRRLGSAQIRNAATLGGNVANGSPIGDGPPALIALGARLVLRRDNARRTIAIEDFFIAYGRQDRAPGEFVEAIRLPLPARGTQFHCYKVSKRFDQDITAVLGAFALTLDGDRVADIRVAYGGMAETPRRAPACEAALRGRPWTTATVEAAVQELARDFAPIDDMRASAAYRALVAGNLLTRFHLETSDAGVETRLPGTGTDG